MTLQELQVGEQVKENNDTYYHYGVRGDGHWCGLTIMAHYVLHSLKVQDLLSHSFSLSEFIMARAIVMFSA